MIKTLLFDFSRVLLHPTDKTFTGSLNGLHRELKDNESYYLFNYFEINTEILEFLKTIQEKYDLRIFTTDMIQNDPLVKEKIDPIFSKIYSANELGVTKKVKESYEFIAKDAGVKPDEIFFTDDTQSNLDAAKLAGLKTHLYINNEDLLIMLKSL